MSFYKQIKITKNTLRIHIPQHMQIYGYFSATFFQQEKNKQRASKYSGNWVWITLIFHQRLHELNTPTSVLTSFLYHTVRERANVLISVLLIYISRKQNQRLYCIGLISGTPCRIPQNCGSLRTQNEARQRRLT